MTNLFHFAGISKRFSAFLLLFFALLCGAATYGQVSIIGRVLDEKTNSALAGATVKVAGSTQGSGQWWCAYPELPFSVQGLNKEAGDADHDTPRMQEILRQHFANWLR